MKEIKTCEFISKECWEELQELKLKMYKKSPVIYPKPKYNNYEEWAKSKEGQSKLLIG